MPNIFPATAGEVATSSAATLSYCVRGSIDIRILLFFLFWLGDKRIEQKQDLIELFVLFLKAFILFLKATIHTLLQGAKAVSNTLFKGIETLIKSTKAHFHFSNIFALL